MLEKEIQQQALRYKTIIESGADGILLLDSIRDENNHIIDFRISHCNAVGLALARFPKDSAGKTLLQILPHLAGADQYNLHKRVVETGEPARFETSFRNEKGEEYGWFIVSLQKLDDGVLSRFVDITENKKNEEKIESQANLVKSILDASINSVYALQAVRDEIGTITDFTFLKINNRFAQFLGKKEEDIVGKSYLLLLETSKSNGMFDLKCKVIETGEPVQKEVYYNANGIEGWFSISLSRLGTDGVVQTFFDITQSKRDRERLSTIVNTSGAGMYTLIPAKDTAGNIVDFYFDVVNQTVAAQAGRTVAELSGSLVSENFPAYKSNGLFGLYKETYLNNIPQELDFHYEGDYDAYLNIKINRLEDELLVTYTNHTLLKKLQLELQKSIADLQRSNDSLEEFTSAASHDLKEPIRKINFFVSLLKTRYKTLNETDPFQTFEKLEVAAKRMVALVDDLLEYSHLSHVEPEFEEIDLNLKLIKVLEDLELVIEEKQAKIVSAKLPVIKGHRRQIQQLFQNLLSNGLKYSKPEVPPEITLAASVVSGAQTGLDLPKDKLNNKYHLIEVSDKGIGFEQKYSEIIFNVFERLHGRNYKGSGVGLSIARKVVENHHGFIRAEGRPNEGATFRVYLPV